MHMATQSEQSSSLPPEQRSIESRCFHSRDSWIYMDPDAQGRAIHEMVEAQAAATPDKLAVVSPACTLTYRQLNQEANHLARAIIAHGQPNDAPIAVCCPLGAAQLAATLAVLKTGRILVSLSSSDPPARSRSILKSTGAQMVVTDDTNWALARTLMPDEDPVLNVDASHRTEVCGDLQLPVRADALVRIALTSGSTGEPKGIMQTHRTALYGAITRNNAVHLCAQDRFLIGTAVFTDLWRPLLVGGTLYLFDIKADDMRCLQRWMNEEDISAFRSTPSVFRQLVAVLAPGKAGLARSNSSFAPSLRVIESMGEPVPRECVLLYQKHFPPRCIFINFLGSKEVLDYRIYYVDHATDVMERFLPGGYPFGGARVTILDDAGETAGPNEVGEIAVENRSMSPGYWRRADLTDERFRASPVDGGSRLYRTGDFGRLMPDNCLICLGRQDSMVKVRGHRVDVTYLEQSLRDLASVTDAAVVVKQTEQQDLLLVAFIVVSTPHSVAERDIRRELAKSLPDYVIPSTIVLLEAMPTTAMGKTDRERLRSMVPAPRPRTASTDLPHTLIEMEIAGMWAEVLERDRVAPQDNFFELGGTSLSVMRVVSRVQQHFDIDLPLVALFQMPTVREFALFVSEALRASERIDVVPRPQLKRRKIDEALKHPDTK
jgi:non-ribosomal peptide synthetase component F/acyl carrier protein